MNNIKPKMENNLTGESQRKQQKCMTKRRNTSVETQTLTKQQKLMRKIRDSSIQRPTLETQDDEIHRPMEEIYYPLDLSLPSTFKQFIPSLEEQLRSSLSSSDENDE